MKKLGLLVNFIIRRSASTLECNKVVVFPNRTSPEFGVNFKDSRCPSTSKRSI